MDSKQAANFIRSHFYKMKYAPSVHVLYSQDAYVAGMILMSTQTRLLSLDDQESLVEEQQALFDNRMKELKIRESK